MGGSSTPSNTSTTTELPAWAQPYAQSLLNRGAALSDQNMPVYQGQRSADMNGAQTTAMGMTAQRALNGSAEVGAGSQNLMDTLNGNYLSAGNPYMQAMIDKNAGDITKQFNGAVNGTDANFARAGAFGGSAWQANQQGNAHELAGALQNSANNLSMQNYTQERQNQMADQPLALQYGQQPYIDAAQLQGVGGQQYGFDQQALTDQQNLFNENANAPYKSLDVLGNTIRGAVGGGSTVSSSGPGQNTAAQVAGGAAALYGAFGK